jgi:hypothetical protein
VLVLRVVPGGVGGECAGRDVDLLGDEGNERVRQRLAEVQQPARVAKGAELQGEPESVPGAAAATRFDRPSWWCLLLVGRAAPR